MSLTEKEKDEYISVFSKIAVDPSHREGADAETISKVIEKYKDHFSLIPKKLYKYRKFDDKNNTLDLIRNNRFYLSSANSLDDAFEASFSLEKSDSAIEKLYKSKKSLDYYANWIFNYFNIPSDKASRIRQYLYSKKALLSLTDFLVQELKIDQGLAEKVSIYLRMYYTPFFEIPICNDAKALIHNTGNCGICSLTENNRSQIMWEYYADHYKGCCLEYSIDEDDYSNLIDLVPVRYRDHRNYKPMNISIEKFLSIHFGEIEAGIQKTSEISFRLVTIKHKEWAFQKEWRIVGAAGYSIHNTPRLSAIYFGHNISEENRNTIIQIAKERHISLFETSFDYEKTEIRFKEHQI